MTQSEIMYTQRAKSVIQALEMALDISRRLIDGETISANRAINFADVGSIGQALDASIDIIEIMESIRKSLQA